MDATTYIQKDLSARFAGCYVPDLTFSWAIIGNTRNLVDAEVEFIVRASINSNTIIERLTVSHGVEIPDENELSFVVTGRNLPATYLGGETYVYSVFVTYSNGDKVPIFRGEFPILKP